MSIFTKRHYIWLASVTRDAIGNHKHYPCPDCDACNFLDELLDSLENESPGFHRDTFVRNVFNPLGEQENRRQN